MDVSKGRFTLSLIYCLANHINSVKRHSLDDRSPFEALTEKDTDLKWLLEKLKMHPILADEVHLTKDLLK